MEESAVYNAIVFYFLLQYYDQMWKKGPVEHVSVPEIILFRKSKNGNISVSNK